MDLEKYPITFRKGASKCTICNKLTYRLKDTKYNKDICLDCYYICLFCHNGIIQSKANACLKCYDSYLIEIFKLYPPLEVKEGACVYCQHYDSYNQHLDERHRTKFCFNCIKDYNKIIESNLYTQDQIDELLMEAIGVEDMVILISNYLFY